MRVLKPGQLKNKNKLRVVWAAGSGGKKRRAVDADRLRARLV